MDEIDKKDVVESQKWALITLHPWLPSRSEQIARARAWGVEETMLDGEDISAVITDDVRNVKRTTNWPSWLRHRTFFLKKWQAYRPEGHVVFFATPLCVGFTEKLAQETIETLWAAGMKVYVHSNCAMYVQGDDIGELLRMIGTDANAAHVRASRRRKAGIPLPEDIDDPIPRGRRRKPKPPIE